MSTSALPKTIPLTIKGAHSVEYPENKAEAFQNERYVLIFDFETNDLPDKSVEWDNFQPNPTIQRYRDGNPVIDRVTRQPKMTPASDSSKWPHSVQFCYILYDNQTNQAKIVNEILRLPEGVTMSAESEAVHKISLEKSQGQTKKIMDPVTGAETMIFNPEIEDVLREFMADFAKADVIVAHNLRFDRNMLLAEMDRLRKRSDPEYEIFEEYIQALYDNKKEFCTANFGADVCKIEAINKAGKEYYKMPKLKVLYENLFGYEPDESKLHDALMDVVICMRCFYKIRYDVDICSVENADAEIVGYINLLSPEGHKCNPSPQEELELVYQRKSPRVLDPVNYKETGGSKKKKSKKRKSKGKGKGKGKNSKSGTRKRKNVKKNK
jgi:DNA polymerase III epsilon subunit-like protein